MELVTKRKFIVMLGLFFVCFLPGLLWAGGGGVNWQQGTATDIASGSAGAFDEKEVASGAVIKDGGTYKLWYTGANASGTYQIGYATSNDGRNWNKHGQPVLSPSASSTWDGYHVGSPAVIKDGGMYKMWYNGAANASGTVASIGYATSTDGVNWTKHSSGSPVLGYGNAGTWDSLAVRYPAVVKISDMDYRMWYTGQNVSSTSSAPMIGYATSSNGVVWSKYYNPDQAGNPLYAESYPVVRNGNVGSWKAQKAFGAAVIKDGSFWRMWFTGQEFDGCYGKTLGFAVSMNGKDWLSGGDYQGNPVMFGGSSGRFDDCQVRMPMVIKDGNKQYEMWYTGQNQSNATAIGHTTSATYESNSLSVNFAHVASNNSAGGKSLLTCMSPQGPNVLDIVTVKVELQGGGYMHYYSPSELVNDQGSQMLCYSESKSSIATGDYVFTVTANNGLTATKTLSYTSDVWLNVPQDGTGAGYLDRSVSDGSDQNTGAQVYTSSVTPTFQWRPALGDQYYYRLGISNWKSTATWYASAWIKGDQKDGNGYLSVTVPADRLKENTPYHWNIQVTDAVNASGSLANTAVHRSGSTNRDIYTGTKDGSGNFLPTENGIMLAANRSYTGGEGTTAGAVAINIAPWDIEKTADEYDFHVLKPDSSTLVSYNVSGNSQGDAMSVDGSLFYYVRTPGGLPANGKYTFKIYDKSHNGTTVERTQNETAVALRVYQTNEPYVNDYLSTTEPTLSWVSRGSGYYYRAAIQDWAGNRPRYFSWQAGAAEGATMSVTVPAGALKEHSPYFWWVETADSNERSAINSRNSSRRIAFTTGFSGGFEGNKSFLGWGGDQLAGVFVNRGPDSDGIWNYNGSVWNRITDWVPKDIAAHQSSYASGASGAGAGGGPTYYLAASFNKYDSGNGIWVYEKTGANWTKLTSWIPEEDMVSWGGGFAVKFRNYGDGNGLWNYTASGWQKLTDWVPWHLSAWGSDKGALAGYFGEYGSGNGIWSYNGSSWAKLTDWQPMDDNNLVALGSDALAVGFDTYGAENGIWKYQGGAWSRMTEWVPNRFDSWGSGLEYLAAGFANYGSGNGIWKYDGASWSKITNWVTADFGAIAGGTLGAQFKDYGSGNGIWKYDGAGTSWTKLSDWLMSDGTSFGNNFAAAFNDYGSGNGIWKYDGASWTKLTDWVPANQN